ncbi:MAG: sensor histidine kinase [bacterium]
MVGIRAKIFLPFAALFGVVLVGVAVLSSHAAARQAEARIQGQMADLAAVLSQAGFARNPEVLARVKTIVGGELATAGADGTVVATTLEARAAEALQARLAAEPPVAEAGGAAPIRRLDLAGQRYRATLAPVGSGLSPDSTYLYLLVPEAEFASAAGRAARPILLAAGCGALAVAVLGFLVGGAIARPIRSLAAQAQALTDGEPEARLTVPSRDEVGRLAEAFNGLLDSLRAAEARVVESERLAAVGQVAAGIAHEVRNPLSGIKMSAQLIGRRLREHSPAEAESVEVMLAEIARLEVIIDDLLTFAGPTRLSRQEADLNAVLGEVLDFMARQLEHASIEVRTKLADDLPPVRLDPRRIRQVVLNLVLNAAEAMPNGGTLTLRTRRADDAVVAEVEDTGHGVEPAVAERIFEPFFTTKDGGSGLGLGVSRTLVEAHGGTLTVEPLEHGTRFTFTLPGGERGQDSAIRNPQSAIEPPHGPHPGR